MASIVLSSLGSTLGNEFLPGLGGRLLGLAGRQIGRSLDGTGTKDGPRLENLRVQDSRYGIGIPLAFGRVRVAGNVIWASNLIETRHEDGLMGGKGGGLGSSSSGGTTYSYSLHCAVAIAAGPIGGLATIWADSKVIYQDGVWKAGLVGSATLYNGTMTQPVDPFLESCIGSGQVPAYRGVAYIVLESLQLKDFGSRLPNLTFEVLPPAVAAQPQWLGSVSSGVFASSDSLRSKALPALVVEGSSVRAQRLIIGGVNGYGSTVSFLVKEYDVTGEAPVPTAQALSASFSVHDFACQSWALAPDNRFVALYGEDNGGTPTHRFAIYDREARQFGAVLGLNLAAYGGVRQLAWLDAQRFVISDSSGGRYGLRVLARSGLGIVDLGFYDVWGAGSTANRVPLFAAQFLPLAGGLLHLAADQNPYFTALYARHVVWQGKALVVGAAYTLTSGYVAATGSGPSACLLRTGDSEWTLFYTTVLDMRVMSFQPGTNSAIVTRPWQTITNALVASNATNHPVVVGDRIVVVQSPSFGGGYCLSEIVLGAGGFTLAVDEVALTGFALAPLASFGAASIDGARLLFIGAGPYSLGITQLGIMRRRNTGAALDTIVVALLDRAGYAAGDYDVAALAAVPVDGYVLAEPMTAAAALEPLQLFAPFDLVESDAQLRAVPHGGTAVVSIPVSEGRASSKAEAEPLPLLEETRLQELDLPVETVVDYLDAERDYEIGSQRARRLATRGARLMAKINVPLVCTAARAKQLAEAQLFKAWVERDHVRLNWSRRWLAVGPGDVVDLGGRLLRVTQTHQAKGVVDVRGVFVPGAPVSAATADGGLSAETGNFAALASPLYLLDLPLLRVEDDQPGVYAAVGGLDGWPGAAMWRAADAVNYTNLARFQAAATAGVAVSALPDAAPYFMDRAGSVLVQLMRGELASCGDADLLNGANVAALGGEILQFQTALLVGPGLYSLSNFLRGRRGTEAATSTHSLGENFVLLTPGTVQFVPALLTDRGRSYSFRALTRGLALGDAVDQPFTYALMTLQPLAPAHVAGSRNGGTGSDLTLSWKRRARKNGDWIDNVDVPLDEPSELYDVEIMNGAAVVRTFSSVSGATQLYSAAQQSADWGGSIPAHFTVNVYQLSARYGRGAKGTATV